MKLIYHNDYKNEISPFDREIVEMIKNEKALIVCPYISLSYLKRIKKLSKEWRLITDMQEWILSNNSQINRQEIKDFIVKNTARIKHIKDVHAKVIFTDKSALIGSANFTDKGIRERTEMSIVIDDKEKIIELNKWFNSLWAIGMIFTKNQLDEFILNNFRINDYKEKIFPLETSKKIKRKALLVDLTNIPVQNEYNEEQLIACIKHLNKSEEWWNNYFDLLREMLIHFKIDSNSPKIALTTRNDLEMRVIIGQRYILLPKKSSEFGMIMPLEFRNIANDFNADINEDYFYRNKVQQALWRTIEDKIVFSNRDNIQEYWMQAIQDELERTQKSGFRKYHNPFYYKMVMDLEYRKHILNQI